MLNLFQLEMVWLIEMRLALFSFNHFHSVISLS